MRFVGFYFWLYVSRHCLSFVSSPHDYAPEKTTQTHTHICIQFIFPILFCSMEAMTRAHSNKVTKAFIVSYHMFAIRLFIIRSECVCAPFFRFVFMRFLFSPFLVGNFIMLNYRQLSDGYFVSWTKMLLGFHVMVVIILKCMPFLLSVFFLFEQQPRQRFTMIYQI